jgi:hypothetical protein
MTNDDILNAGFGYLPMMKVGPGCMIGIQYHVIMRQTEGMFDMQSQEL